MNFKSDCYLSFLETVCTTFYDQGLWSRIFLPVSNLNVNIKWTFQERNLKFVKSYSPYILICKLHSNHKETFKREILRSQGIKGKSPEVPFHGITSSYSYFEVIWILRQFSKKQNMIKKNYQLNWTKKVCWHSPAMFCLFTHQAKIQIYSRVKLIPWK